jgi:aconitate hydratase
MPLNVAQKLITAHLSDGSLCPGTPITLKIDQTLTQDATGTRHAGPGSARTRAREHGS